MALGDRIRSAREAAGWSQETLAAKLGVTQRAVSNWERGTVVPRSLGRIEQVLGVQLRGIVGSRDAPPVDEASDARLLTELSTRLAERDQRNRDLNAELERLREQLREQLPGPRRIAARDRDIPAEDES